MRAWEYNSWIHGSVHGNLNRIGFEIEGAVPLMCGHSGGLAGWSDSLKGFYALLLIKQGER